MASTSNLIMIMRNLIPFLIVLSSCNSSVSNSKDSVDNSVNVNQSPKEINLAKGNPTQTMETNRFLGAWTDGTTENATFDIGKDSIFYLNEMTSFPYTLKGDSLTIGYPDMSFQGTAKFFGDTLVLIDPEFGTTKYTRFKN